MEVSAYNYLHLYLGCDVMIKYSAAGTVDSEAATHFAGPFKLKNVELSNGKVQVQLDGYMVKATDVIKPILRPLSNITEEEATECGWVGLFTLAHFAEKKLYRPDSFPFLLSKCFDLLGLIEAGLAIDQTKLKGVI